MPAAGQDRVSSRVSSMQPCATHLCLASPKVRVIVKMEMHEERKVGPQIVMSLLVAVEVQAEVLKLIATLATDEAYGTRNASTEKQAQVRQARAPLS